MFHMRTGLGVRRRWRRVIVTPPHKIKQKISGSFPPLVEKPGQAEKPARTIV
jgi:hypothetical protein